MTRALVVKIIVILAILSVVLVGIRMYNGTPATTPKTGD
jgi:hypothetical protein